MTNSTLYSGPSASPTESASEKTFAPKSPSKADAYASISLRFSRAPLPQPVFGHGPRRTTGGAHEDCGAKILRGRRGGDLTALGLFLQRRSLSIVGPKLEGAIEEAHRVSPVPGEECDPPALEPIFLQLGVHADRRVERPRSLVEPGLPLRPTRPSGCAVVGNKLLYLK